MRFTISIYNAFLYCLIKRTTTCHAFSLLKYYWTTFFLLNLRITVNKRWAVYFGEGELWWSRCRLVLRQLVDTNENVLVCVLVLKIGFFVHCWKCLQSSSSVGRSGSPKVCIYGGPFLLA